MYDYHVHSSVSADGTQPMKVMVQAGLDAGLSEIAITDHFDPDYCISGWPTTLDFDAYHKEQEEAEAAFRGRIQVIRGLEIGIQHGKTLDTCRKVAQAYDYDFLIGSFHCACGKELSCGGYFDGLTMEEGFRNFYEYVYSCLSDYDDFSVLGHINVLDRYGDYVPKDDVYMDIIEEIFRLLIHKGKGIEINTSSFRYGMGDRTTPTVEMLRMYKQLGGEIITIGSDAHYPEHVAYGWDWASETLKTLGYRYITTFRHMEPVFQTL